MDWAAEFFCLIHVISVLGAGRDVKSISIPYVHITSTCHKATPHSPRGHSNSDRLYPAHAQIHDPPSHARHIPSGPRRKAA